MTCRQSVFVHIPKMAGRSIKTVLGQYPEVRIIEYSKPTEVDYELFTFAFVRHPLDRFVSSYYHLVDAPTDQHDPYNVRRRLMFRRYGHDINQFIQDDAHRAKDFAFPHFLSIEYWEPRRISFIGHFEQLDNDWTRLCAELGIEHCPLPHISKHRTDYGGRQALTDDSVAKLHSVYAFDFAFGGYA